MNCGASILLYVAALAIAAGCRTAVDPPPPPAPTAAPVPAAAPAAPAAEPVSFEASVKPLLARTCTPCHVPGGRMYERLPFDQPEVVLSHKEGVMRRMKDPDNRALMERWYAENGKS
jgi:hypothetical protein